jgi:cytochrome c556
LRAGLRLGYAAHIPSITKKEAIMKRCASVTTTLLLGLAFSSAAMAVTTEDAIKYRKSVMAAQQWHMLAMGAMVKGDTPYDKADFERRAESVAHLNKMFMEGFTVTGADKGESRAKPEVWATMEKFKGGAEKLGVESAKLVQAAQSGDMKAIKTQYGDVQGVCKGCHDSFQRKER